MDSQNPSTQQFCLRWNNHQTSLLNSLPLLLDQSHLTDVTLSAEGKTLRAHRVVLSACSTYFFELFHTLDPSCHPVIVIPGTSFSAVVALLSFMYSGEVNVFEEQIPSLIALAETLGIKGLADFQNNNLVKSSKIEVKPARDIYQTPPSISNISPSLENFLIKSLQLYPNLVPQPLNFSQSIYNRSMEELTKYRFHHNFEDSQKYGTELRQNENCGTKPFSGHKTGEVRKIDQIAESLRTATIKSHNADSTSKISKNSTLLQIPTTLILKPPPFTTTPHEEKEDNYLKDNAEIIAQKQQTSTMTENLLGSLSASNPSSYLLKTTGSPQAKSTNSKLYATCFVCHKQLSNQYNLRVHLETHQNVRYACNACSHVSRSKDALRKHISYRHPGTSNPSESEARRRKSRGINNSLHTATTKTLENLTTQTTINKQRFIFLQNQFNNVDNSQTSTSPITTLNDPNIKKEPIKVEPTEPTNQIN